MLKGSQAPTVSRSPLDLYRIRRTEQHPCQSVSLLPFPVSQFPMLATSTFSLKRWDEKPFDEIDGGPKITRASVLYEFEGELSGEGRLEYLMSYLPDSTATFVGYQRFVGQLGSRQGSFVFQHGGHFA